MIMAAACGIKVLGISVVTNMAAGVLPRALTLAEVDDVCQRVDGDFKKLIRTAARVLAAE